MLPQLGALRPWTDPTVTALHRLPAHVPLHGFTRRSLDGTWNLELFDNPDAVPAAALTGRRPRASEVDVPGNWTMQDTAPGPLDLPGYTNVQMPFPGPPPRLPDPNPTGVYRRSFEVPKAWMTRQVVLHIGAAEGVHAVYVNGEVVGYGTDSRLPSEYDVTSQLQPGTNEVAVVVIRFSAHSYVEDQDQWWMAGLHRSVWIEARNPVHLADLPIDTDFDPSTGVGRIEVTAVVDPGTGGAGAVSAARLGPGWVTTVTVADPDGRPVGPATVTPVPHDDAQPYVFAGFATTSSVEVARARPWSVDHPHRYGVTVELVDPRGRVVQTETQRVGLRRIEIRDRKLLVNGVAPWIFGVNRHDHHPDRGKAVTVDDMRADLVAMRAHNITAIRTAHYPNDHPFLDLCDEYGFLVVAEANIECHSHNRHLADDPRWRSAWLERGARMVQRDRNHPSVILWSLGNESGYGTAHDALAGWIRRVDPSRPLHYEDAIRVEGWVDGGRRATDVVCPMYPEMADVERYGASGTTGPGPEHGAGERPPTGSGFVAVPARTTDRRSAPGSARADRPMILCEYSHAMGNSNGSLADYWDLFTTIPGLQGGFLWEWKDHGLRHPVAGPRNPDGSPRLAYGGLFGEVPHDGNFVADGLMSSDLEPHPAMREVAWVHRPVTVARARGGLRISNRQVTADLAGLSPTWELVTPEGVVDRGDLSVPAVPAGHSVVVPLPEAVTDRAGAGGRTTTTAEPGGPRWLTIRWVTTERRWFADVGHLVAWDQISLGGRFARPRPVPAPASPAQARPGGLLDGLEPEPTLWRAPTDNDGFKLMPELAERIGVGGQALQRWRAAGVDRLGAEELVGHEVRADRSVSGSVRWRHRFDVPEELADLPRIGVRFALPGRFDRIRWFGRGPHENYPDRNRAALFGIWEAAPEDCPYLVPQEYGLRTDCRWIELIDSDSNQVVRIDALAPRLIAFSALRHRSEDLSRAAHADELVRSEKLFVHLDAAHRGLGTASCGPDVAERHRIPPGRHRLDYRISVI